MIESMPKGCAKQVCVFLFPPLTYSQDLSQTVNGETCIVLGGLMLLKSHKDCKSYFSYSIGKIFLLKHCMA